MYITRHSLPGQRLPLSGRRRPGDLYTDVIDRIARAAAQADDGSTNNASLLAATTRPPPAVRPGRPTGLRRVADVVSRVLLVGAALAIGFVAYVMWGTGLHTSRSQDRLEAQFVAITDTTSATTPIAMLAPSTTAEPEPVAIPAEPASTISTTHLVTPIQPIGFTPRYRDVVAHLQIPTAHIDDFIVGGSDVEALRDGPGHAPQTPLPGQQGLAVIAGHRTTYGAPFGDLDLVQVGDRITVNWPSGETFDFEVTEATIIPADELQESLVALDANDAELLLVTCHPKQSVRERIVIRASLTSTSPTPMLPAPAQPDLQYGNPNAVVENPAAGPVAADIVVQPDGDEISIEARGGDSGESDGWDHARLSRLASSPANIDAGPHQPAAATGHSAVVGSGLTGSWFADTSAYPALVMWAIAALLISRTSTILMLRPLLRSWGSNRPGRLAARLVTYGVFIAPFAFALFWFYAALARLVPLGV